MYRERINKALRFIDENLSEELTVAMLAEAAHFSPFHFLRIYKGLQNETPYDTILRLRLEKAIFLLRHYPRKAIADVAGECGFPSIENFSRQFRKRFGCAPSAFRNDPDLKSKIYQEPNENDPYHCIEQSRTLPAPDFTVTVELLPRIPIAFVRALFGADGRGLLERYNELISWAGSHELPYQGELRRFGMSLDDHSVTPAELYRYDFALAIDRRPASDGIVEFGEIPEGRYATLHCVGDLTLVAQAWDHLYAGWLPKSGYVPVHYPAIEEFVRGPEEIGWETFDIKCRVPVIPVDAL